MADGERVLAKKGKSISHASLTFNLEAAAVAWRDGEQPGATLQCSYRRRQSSSSLLGPNTAANPIGSSAT